MVRQWQESFYGNRFSNSYMKNGMPDFATLAKAYGLEGAQVFDQKGLLEALQRLNLSSKGFLVDVSVVENQNCYPMVAPGKSNSQMIGLESFYSVSQPA